MDLLASIWDAQLWYLLPLILVVSLVYGGTRHEYLKEIIQYAVRAAVWMVVFLGIIFVLVWWGTANV